MNLLYASGGPADSWLINGLRQAHHGVTLARDLADALHKLEGQVPDVVVLDRVGDPSGWLARLKAAAPAAGLALLSEHPAGTIELPPPEADLHLHRPIDSTEVARHLEALLVRLAPRRARGDVTLLPHRRAARVGDTVVTLTAQEFQLLSQLLRHPDRPLGAGELCQLLWKDEHGASKSALRLLVYRLRAKFRDSVGRPVIRSRPRLGYSLES